MIQRGFGSISSVCFQMGGCLRFFRFSIRANGSGCLFVPHVVMANRAGTCYVRAFLKGGVFAPCLRAFLSVVIVVCHCNAIDERYWLFLE